MSDKTHVSVNGGFGLFSMAALITTAFIVMKCAEYGAVAAWSWWWVFCPLWIWGLFLIGMIATFFIFLLMVGIIASIFEK